MQRIIPLSIKDDYIIGDGVEVGGAGSHDEVVLRMDFRGVDSVWDGTAKTVRFANSAGTNVTTILLSLDNAVPGVQDVYDVPIPFEAKEYPGDCFMCVVGVITENTRNGDAVEKLKCVTQVATFKVLESRIALTGGNIPDQITPDVAEQLFSAINALDNSIPGRIAEKISAHNSNESAHKVLMDNIKQYSDTQDEATLQAAKKYTDENGGKQVLQEAKDYADSQDVVTLAAANDYANQAAEAAIVDSKTYTDAQDAKTLQAAKDYADKATNGTVKSVNGNTPDSNGNVKVSVPQKVSELTNDEYYENSQTIFVKETIAEITDEASFRTYFYNQRKSTYRRWLFEINEGGINENIVTGVGGRPDGTNAKDKAFILVEIPFSEAGGYIIKVTYEGRTNGAYYEKKIFGTLDSNWHDTGWYKATFISTAVITPYGGGYVADMTSRQIIDADRKGIVKAEFEDPKTNELRTYYYAKQMPSPDNRAVFSKDGYIEDGIPKQTLIYVDYAGNVTTETRSPFVDDAISETSMLPVQNKVVKEYVDNTFAGAMKKVDGTDGQFALSDGKGGIRFASLLNLDTEAR